MLARAPIALLLTTAWASLAGCGSVLGDKENRLGEPLGHYHIVGQAGASSCGAGALGATSPWEFDLALARDGASLYWGSDASPATGRIDSDNSFAVQSSSSYPIHPATKQRGACTLTRNDDARGKLTGSDLDIPSFSATLTFQFQPTAEDDCSDAIGVAKGFDQLPCAMVYDLAATRVSR